MEEEDKSKPSCPHCRSTLTPCSSSDAAAEEKRDSPQKEAFRRPLGSSSTCSRDVSMKVEVLFVAAEEAEEDLVITNILQSMPSLEKLELAITGSPLLCKEIFSFLVSVPLVSSLVVTFKEHSASNLQHLWHSLTTNTTTFSILSDLEFRCFTGLDSEVAFIAFMLRSTPALVSMKIYVRLDRAFTSLRSTVSNQRKMHKERVEKWAIVEPDFTFPNSLEDG